MENENIHEVDEVQDEPGPQDGVLTQRSRSSSTSSSSSSCLSTVLDGLSEAEVANSFAYSMKMWQTNKISTKTAFKISMIDHLYVMMKKKDPKFENFAKASLMLGAAQEVYAKRVDAIDEDVMKLACCLNIMRNAMATSENAVTGAAGEPEENVCITQKEPRRKKKTIETDLAKLQVDESKMKATPDDFYPLHTCRKSQGYLLHELQIGDNFELLLDGTESELAFEEEGEEEEQPSYEPSATNTLVDMFLNLDLEGKEIDPYFSSFTFSNWSLEEEGETSNEKHAGEGETSNEKHAGEGEPNEDETHDQAQSHNDYVFDPSAIPEPVPEVTGPKRASQKKLLSRSQKGTRSKKDSYGEYASIIPSGPGAWKAPARGPRGRVVKERKRYASKGTFELNWNDIPDEDILVEDETKLQRRVSKNFKPEDLLCPSINREHFKILTHYYLDPNRKIFEKRTETVDGSGMEQNSQVGFLTAFQDEPSPSPSQNNTATPREEQGAVGMGFLDSMRQKILASSKTSDVKALKKAMWSEMAPASEQCPEGAIDDVILFTDLCHRLEVKPGPFQGLKIEVSVAFAALLSLANEKNLYLSGCDMTDIVIAQDLDPATLHLL